MSKIEIIVDWSLPHNIKQLRGFLGLISYYRHFIKGYASITWPLNEMLTHDSSQWTPKSELPFQQPN